MVIDRVGEQADPNYQRPDYFPDESLGMKSKELLFYRMFMNGKKDLVGLI